jgi:outer membrane receptor protein involved in Fe transport
MEVRTKRDQQEVVQHTLEIEEVRRVPGALGDAVRALQNLPGVARAPFGQGQLLIRGTGPEDTGTYLDGMRVPILFHFTGLLSVFNASLLDRIDYYPGGFPVRFGRSIGGAVELTTRDDIPERLHGYAEVDLLNSSFFIQGSAHKKLGYSLSARRSYIDYLANPLLEDRAGLLVRFPRFWDAQLKLDYKPAASDRYQLMLFASDDRFSVLGQGGDLAEQGSSETFGAYTTAVKGRMRWDHAFSPRLENRLGVQLGPDAQSVQFGAGEIRFNPLYLHVRDEIAWSAAHTLKMRGGLDVQVTRFDFTIDLPPPEGSGLAPVHLEESAWGISPSPYLEAEWTIGDQLTLVPGLRVDPLYVFDQYSAWSVDPRIAFRSRVMDGTVIKGSIGRYSQFPQPQQLSRTLGTPELEPEHAIQISLGFEQAITPAIHLDVIGYHNVLEDLVQAGPDGGYGRLFGGTQSDEPAYTNEGRGRNYGIELLLRHDFTHRFFGWISYTLSRAERSVADERTWRLSDLDQPHVLCVLGSYRLPRRWEISARFRYASGSPYRPVVAAYQDLDHSSWTPVYGEENSARNEAFHALDVRVQKDWTFTRWKMQAYVDVQNIYNRLNAESTFYTFDYREALIVPSLPILPVVGLRGEF